MMMVTQRWRLAVDIVCGLFVGLTRKQSSTAVNSTNICCGSAFDSFRYCSRGLLQAEYCKSAGSHVNTVQIISRVVGKADPGISEYIDFAMRHELLVLALV